MDGQDIIGIQWNLHQVSSYTVKLTHIFLFQFTVRFFISQLLKIGKAKEEKKTSGSFTVSRLELTCLFVLLIFLVAARGRIMFSTQC